MAKAAPSLAKVIASLKKLEAEARTAHTKARSAPAVIESRAKLAAYTQARKLVETLEDHPDADA